MTSGSFRLMQQAALLNNEYKYKLLRISETVKLSK